jgi:hypothetical protein
LEFSWANTLIDPTSVEFRALGHADEVEVLDVSFPPRVANTLEWRIRSDFAGEVPVEIRYFTSGISWSADYVAEAGQTEKRMDLAGFVRVNNQSGEDYENAQVRLLVGVVRLVEEIATLARQQDSRDAKKPMTEALAVNGAIRADMFNALHLGIAGGSMAQSKREIVKEGLSEYFLYTVEGRDTIPHGWSKRMPSFHARDLPITSFYKFEAEVWGPQVVRYYRFTNSVASNLGKEPLPDGAVKAFRFVTDDRLYTFVGRTSVKYIPINEQVDLELGNDLEVLVKPTLMNWEKTEVQFDRSGNVAGWTIKESWQIEVQNSKDIDVVVDIRRNFNGDWSLLTQSNYENVEATKVKFILPLKPREKQTFTYQLTTRQGANVTR